MEKYSEVEHGLMNENAELKKENKRLRAELADSVSRETVIVTEQERDEAREASRELWEDSRDYRRCDEADLKQWPWLEDTDG